MSVIQQLLASYGSSKLVLNGTFDDTSAWIGNDGSRAWTISDGAARCSIGSGVATLWQSVNFTRGAQYRLTYTIKSISGASISAYLYNDGNQSNFTIRSSEGTYAQTITASASGSDAIRRLYFACSAFGSAIIDDVILEAV